MVVRVDAERQRDVRSALAPDEPGVALGGGGGGDEGEHEERGGGRADHRDGLLPGGGDSSRATRKTQNVPCNAFPIPGIGVLGGSLSSETITAGDARRIRRPSFVSPCLPRPL